MHANLFLAAAMASALSLPAMSVAQERATKVETERATSLHAEGQLPAFTGATAWLNSPPLTPKGLRGKVVLVDFLTYTCINWQRTHPHIRRWAEKHGHQGLVVIGVHAPEFEFEKDLGNVRAALQMLRVEYPVAVDNDHAIWRAFANQYWPAVYIADANGNIRYHHFGEGGYAQQEAVIEQLLREAGYPAKSVGDVELRVLPSEAPADWNDLRSPENYLGAARTEGFVPSMQSGVPGDQTFIEPRSLALNQWSLAGEWTLGQQAITLVKPKGRIVYRFHARDVHLVMGPSAPGRSVRFRVRVDGRPPGDARGEDVDASGNGTVTFPRLYQLLRQPKPIVDRLFEIEFLDSGIQAFAFTFG